MAILYKPELNLLSHGPDVKEVRFGNYQIVEHLPKDEYTYEQAQTRLEQIKIFRKYTTRWTSQTVMKISRKYLW
jgi:hypothetical protein